MILCRIKEGLFLFFGEKLEIRIDIGLEFIFLLKTKLDFQHLINDTVSFWYLPSSF